MKFNSERRMLLMKYKIYKIFNTSFDLLMNKNVLTSTKDGGNGYIYIHKHSKYEWMKSHTGGEGKPGCD